MEEIGHKTPCSLLKPLDVIVDTPLGMKLTQGIPNKPQEIRLVHGEAPAKVALTEQLTKLGYYAT